ncbi:hypothetical protein JRQ81_018788 [Phrynocephalus forsythii]|uniref:Zinc finger CW-type PWWP domain protein 2 n=1 Tax=Phrynocephalus forsythii TaxID=171643 RepID=A0A9Q0XSJ2_9SAUR|nr:hypothetical protein JRQ81_018788 [Phrynocephalus forsythii]
MDSRTDHNFYLGRVWVQCENSSCLKWRLLRHDAAAHVDPNAPWYCSMNADPQFNKCSVSEEDFPGESEFRKQGLKYIYSKFPLGSVILAKMQSWPRWPGILCPDPVNGQYVTYDLDGNVESHHVEFLGKPHSRQWVLIKYIGLYPSLFKADACKRKKGWYRSALDEANKLLSCSVQQRLESCYLSKTDTVKNEKSKTKMDTILCRKVIKAKAEVCEKKNSYKIGRQKKLPTAAWSLLKKGQWK